ncbi:MAG: PAS domain S-box protein [Bacteroidia bacterium]|nr:PAS domain S-box protein [Bacteroidia bacterium]
MTITNQDLKLLIVEDNSGDFILIDDYLKEEVKSTLLSRAKSFAEAQSVLLIRKDFDVILLDLTLPDLSGDKLVREILLLAGQIPVIVLTGYSDKEFGVKTLALGVSDYLLKDELNAYQLYKSIAYSRERKRIEISLMKSNERYEIVAKATSDTIWDLDIVNDKMQYNNGIHEMFGYSSREIAEIGVWWKEKLHPEDIQRVTEALAEMYEKGEVHLQIEYRFRCADGSYKYIFDRGFLMTGENAEPLRMIGAMQDITRQKEEENRLRLLESVITNATDAVMITAFEPLGEPGPAIVYVNNAFTKMTGYLSNEVIGKSPRFLQGPKTSKDKLNALSECLRKGESCELEVINYHKDGSEYWVQLAIAPVANGLGEHTHFIAIERDVTERIKHLQAIEDQNTKLKEIAWTQSHVVRAPLARIMGIVDLFNSDALEEHETHEYLNYILSSANELDAVIKSIVLKTSAADQKD